NPELDNFHPTKGYAAHSNDDRFVGMNSVPLEGDLKNMVLRRNLWMETEKAYRQAVSQYGRVVAEQGLHTEEDKCADFTKEQPVQQIAASRPEELNPQQLANNVKMLSALYKKY